MKKTLIYLLAGLAVVSVAESARVLPGIGLKPKIKILNRDYHDPQWDEWREENAEERKRREILD